MRSGTSGLLEHAEALGFPQALRLSVAATLTDRSFSIPRSTLAVEFDFDI